MVLPVIPALRSQRQKDQEFQARPGYIVVMPYLRKMIIIITIDRIQVNGLAKPLMHLVRT